MNNQKVSQYVLLAESAYADLADKDTKLLSTEKDIKDAFKNSVLSKTNPNSDQINIITSNWDIKAHWKDRAEGVFDKESSFSGTLLQNKITGKYVLALKGTKEDKDLKVTDIGDIVLDGLAHHQIVDMYNFWQQVNTQKDQTYQAASIITDKELTRTLQQLKNYESYRIKSDADFEALLGYPKPKTEQEVIDKFGYKSSSQMIQKLSENGYLIDGSPYDYQEAVAIRQITFQDSGEAYAGDSSRMTGLGIAPDQIIVVGHSLGGHLAAAFTRLFPEETEHAYMVNGAGFGGSESIVSSVVDNNVQLVFNKLNGSINFHEEKITNIIGNKYFKVIAQDWEKGLLQPGQSEEIFIEKAGKEEIYGHEISQMTDTMMVSSLFFKLDKSLDEGSIHSAFKILTSILNASTNQEDQSLESALYALDKMLSDDKSIVTKIETDNRDQLYEKIKELSNKIDAAKASGKIISLADTDFDWQKEAGKDTAEGIAIRYALKEFNPFAVVGFDYSKINQDKTLDLSSKDNPKGMSKSYIDDRAAMLALKLDYDVANKDYDEQMGSFGIISQFKSGDWQYKDIGKNLNLEIDGVNLVNEHQIIFGSEKNDHLAGGKLNDRLYGGAGDDTLYGGAGDDRMEGGAGFDRYFIEGFDTVFDSDGKGALYFGDLQLTPGTLKGNGRDVWQSFDEKGNATKDFIATRELGKDDLRVVTQGGKHSVKIENFFSMAERGERDAYQMLGLTLETLTEEEKMPKLPSSEELSQASLMLSIAA
ncbi:MAG: hypothetical protein Q4G42_03420 [Neisseria sp.]|nr:hypothetical protein [Neisseria sp.]